MKRKTFRYFVYLLIFTGILVGITVFENLMITAAQIEDALELDKTSIDFGVVFPREYLQETVKVMLTEDFINTGDEGWPNSVNYKIDQKPKCAVWEGSECKEYLNNLCLYLEKISAEGEGDAESDAFLSLTDTYDTWNVNLSVPCIEGHCEQGYSGPVLPEAGTYACDLWFEVINIDGTGISKALQGFIVKTVNAYEAHIVTIFATVVENQPPVANIEPDQLVEVSSGDRISFDGFNSYDPEGQNISYKWDFGDGETSEGPSVKHRFRGTRFRGTIEEPKSYTVTLTVEDDKGNIDTDAVPVTVMPLEKPIEIFSSLPTLPPVLLIKVTAYYNWITEENGQDIYIVTRIHLKSELLSAYVSYMLVLWDGSHTVPIPAWSDSFRELGKVERNFTYPFNSYKDWVLDIEGEHFEGLAVSVNPNDVLQLIALGIEFPLKKVFYVSSAINFDPSSTEEPIIPPEWEVAMLQAKISSPGELRIYDSEGNITGLVGGEIREEIPNSIYDAENKTVIIFSPLNTYRYEVVGTEEGTYGLIIISVENGETTTFTATDIPTTAESIHQYTIDWDALSQGEEGVALQIDADGDSIFEQTVTADNDLTYYEFILQTETIIDFDPDILNLEGEGRFVTTYIELPEGYGISQIDISSIMLNGLVPALSKPIESDDYDGNGKPDLMVKFDRPEVQAILSPGEGIIITLTGKVFYNGSYIDFKGSDVIKVIDPTNE